jgi:hypothetical protein
LAANQILKIKLTAIGVFMFVGPGSAAAGDLKALIQGLQAKDSFERQQAGSTPRPAAAPGSQRNGHRPQPFTRFFFRSPAALLRLCILPNDAPSVKMTSGA